MGGKPTRAGPDDGRVSLGVPAIDAMLEGGLVAHRPYLVVGPSGTGKTTLALQFLCEGVRRGERGLYITVENPPNEIRVNHRALGPDLDRVEVFDAIPDVMRYEKIPFKDISSMREIIPFERVPLEIRQSPEFQSVEVTVAALEQMLRAEVPRRKYRRIVIDSLTALQYFCMKGLDTTTTAQTFLRFLSDLGTTALLTVESPLEEVETPERVLARGEIRLFRWELDGQTVRAIGVEKFRGSSHDVRLHPYRLGPKGLDVTIGQTVSRDSRRIVEAAAKVISPALAGLPEPPGSVSDAVQDLLTLGADVAPVREEVEAALADLREPRPERTEAHLARLAALVISLAQPRIEPPPGAATLDAPQAAAVQRAVERADRARTGVPPTQPPPPEVLRGELENVLSLLSATSDAPRAPLVATGPRAAAEPGVAGPSPTPVRRSRSTGVPPGALDRWSAEEAASPPPPRPAPASPAKGDSIPAPPPLPTAPAPARPVPEASAPGPSPAPARVAPAPASPPPARIAEPPKPPAPGTPPLPSPPLPSVGPPAVAPAAPTSRPVPAPAREPVAPATEAPPPPPVPRRRKRSSAAKTASATSETVAEAPAEESTAAGDRPRRRAVRRRKAPPVVGATEESIPPGVFGNDPPPPPSEGG